MSTPRRPIPPLPWSCVSQASSQKNMTVVIPSDYLNLGSTYAFVLRVATMLGGSAQATATVFKSAEELLSLKVWKCGYGHIRDLQYSTNANVVPHQLQAARPLINV